MSRAPGRVWLLVLCSVMAAGAAAAGAAEGPRATPLKTAKGHLLRGQSALSSGQYQQAFDELSAGYAIAPRPGFLLGMAHAQRGLGKLREARALYARFLAEDPSSKLAPDVRRILQELDRALAPEAVPVAPKPAAPAPDLRVPPPYPRTLDPGPVGVLVLGSSPARPAAASTQGSGHGRAWLWGVAGALVVVAGATGAALALRSDGGESFHEVGTLGSARP